MRVDVCERMRWGVWVVSGVVLALVRWVNQKWVDVARLGLWWCGACVWAEMADVAAAAEEEDGEIGRCMARGRGGRGTDVSVGCGVQLEVIAPPRNGCMISTSPGDHVVQVHDPEDSVAQVLGERL